MTSWALMCILVILNQNILDAVGSVPATYSSYDPTRNQFVYNFSASKNSSILTLCFLIRSSFSDGNGFTNVSLWSPTRKINGFLRGLDNNMQPQEYCNLINIKKMFVVLNSLQGKKIMKFKLYWIQAAFDSRFPSLTFNNSTMSKVGMPMKFKIKQGWN